MGRRICVRPVWLCRNVIGPLLAPHWFLFGMPREKFGKASKEDIELALRAFESYLSKKGTPSPFVVTADEAIEVLLFLELCIPLEGGKYQITALLNDKMRPTRGIKIRRSTYIVARDTSAPNRSTSSRRRHSSFSSLAALAWTTSAISYGKTASN